MNSKLISKTISFAMSGCGGLICFNVSDSSLIAHCISVTRMLGSQFFSDIGYFSIKSIYLCAVPLFPGSVRSEVYCFFS